MAFNLVGDVAELCFDPHFAAIQQFIHNTSEKLGEDISLMRLPTAGYSLHLGGVATLGERYIHVSWDRLWYWSRRQLILFPEELVVLSMALPANPPEGVKRRG